MHIFRQTGIMPKCMFVALLTTTFSSLVKGLDPHEILHARWNMDEPNITYFTENNTFVLDFPTGSPNNTLNGMQHEFYDINCKFDGSNFTEYIIPSGIYGPDGVSAPQMTLDGQGGLPQLQFQIDPAVLSQDDKIYMVINASDVDSRRQLIYGDGGYGGNYGGGSGGGSGGGNGTYTGGGDNNAGSNGADTSVEDLFGNGTSTTNDTFNCPAFDNTNFNNSIRKLSGDRELYDFQASDVGKGVMRMCVRSSLGYPKNATYFREVNFIESLIYVFYDLTAGFCVLSVNVEPKDRLITSVQKDTYELEAWLCDLSQSENRTNSDRSLPAPVPSTYMTATSNVTNATYFNQGDLLTVCVAPDDYAYNEGIRMDGLTSFTWKRYDQNFTPEEVSQPAITNGIAASNLLTYYPYAECIGGSEYCRFSSILFADFYRSRGVTYGDGSAKMTFATTRRRLGEPKEEASARRFLQESDSPSSFDVFVPVDYNEDGPISLKTAGTVSSFGFCTTLVASIFSLLCGALLLAWGSHFTTN